MTVFHIKLIAIALMIIDHIGAYLFPQFSELRIIGRLSFPLFAWLIANGYRHTSNINRYLIRLLLFAFISQLPFALVNLSINVPASNLNIFFTLWIGLATIVAASKFNDLAVKIIIVSLGAILGWILPVDYGIAGVLSIIAFHFSFKKYWLMFALQLAIFTTFFTIPLAINLASNPNMSVHPVSLWQPFAAASVLVISLYNNQKGSSMKYIFYLFYPAHLLIIYGLQRIFTLP